MAHFLTRLPILMGAPEASGGSASGQMATTFVTFGLVILIFYFLIIRPQNKRQKETQKMLAALKKGDKIVTAGGIRGTVLNVKDHTVMVKVDDNTKLEFNKSAVTTILDKAELKEEKAEKKDNKEE